jgi:hypothetical protein
MMAMTAAHRVVVALLLLPHLLQLQHQRQQPHLQRVGVEPQRQQCLPQR